MAAMFNNDLLASRTRTWGSAWPAAAIPCGLAGEAGQHGQHGDEFLGSSQAEAPADIANVAKVKSAANIFRQGTTEF
jgi:hypothetical protein